MEKIIIKNVKKFEEEVFKIVARYDINKVFTKKERQEILDEAYKKMEEK